MGDQMVGYGGHDELYDPASSYQLQPHSAPQTTSHGFTKHLDPATGKFFYYDPSTQLTTWDKPIGEVPYIAAPSTRNDELIKKRRLARIDAAKRSGEIKEVMELIKRELLITKNNRVARRKMEANKAERQLWHQALDDAVRCGEINMSWKKDISISKQVYTFEKDFGRNLVSLRLVGCGLTHVPDEVGDHLKNLEVLQLSSNRLTALPDNFSALTRLTELGLLNNQVEKLPPRIGLMCSLAKIEVSNNRLSEIPDTFAALTKLDRVILENNELTVLPENLEAMFNCRTLNVSNNNLLRLPRCIGRMPMLINLSASNNKLTYIPTEIIQSKTLRVLRLNKNQIESFPGRIGDLKKLIEISIDYNQLKGFPVSFYNLTKLKILRVEGNRIVAPEQSIISRGAIAVVEWCRKRFQEDEKFRMRQIISATQHLLEEVVAREMYDPSRFEPDTMLDSADSGYKDPWYAMQLEHFFDELIPTFRRTIHQEALEGKFNEGGLKEFPYDRKEVVWAFSSFADTSGVIMKRQKAYFRRCACRDETGRRKVCVPPKMGFMCYRMCTLLKGALVLKQLKADRVWSTYKTTGIEDAVKRAESEAKGYLDSFEGNRWLTKLSFERAEEYLLERGAGKALKWRDKYAERKKKNIVRKYNKLIGVLTKQRDKKIDDWRKDLAVLEEKVKTAREGYMKTVTNAKITDLTTKIAEVEENDKIVDLQKECEEECQAVDDDVFDAQESDSDVDSEIEDHLEKLRDKGTEEALEEVQRIEEKIFKKTGPVMPTGPRKKLFYDEYNKSKFTSAKKAIMDKMHEAGMVMSEEHWDQMVWHIKQQKKKLKAAADMMEIRFSKLMAIYAGDFNELQKEMQYELYFQYTQHAIAEAKRKAEHEFRVIEQIRESFGGASLGTSFNDWKKWVKNKKRRVRRDTRYKWRRIMKGFEASMESVVIAEAQANLWEKCADIYSDHIFYKHKNTGDISWERPTVATYLPPGYKIPDPPEPLPPGVSIDTSSDSEGEGHRANSRAGGKRSKGDEVLKLKNVEDDNEGDTDEDLDDDQPEGDEREAYYIATITSVACRELINVEASSLSVSFKGIQVVAGDNDPYVMFRFGDWVEKTEHIDDAGAECEWNDLNFQFHCTSKTLATELLSVQVYDYNAVLAHTFIGDHAFNLNEVTDERPSSLIDNLQLQKEETGDDLVEREFEIDIHTSDGTKAGVVTMRLTLQVDVEREEERAKKDALKERARQKKEAAMAKNNALVPVPDQALVASTDGSNDDSSLTLDIGASAHISLKKKFSYPGAPRKWPAHKPLHPYEMVVKQPSEDEIYGSTEDAVYTYGPDSLRAHLPGILARPVFQEEEEDEGTGLDPEMEKSLNAAKTYMLSADYAAHALNKTEAQKAALGIRDVVIKSPEKSMEIEIERSMDVLKKKREDIGKNRKNLYLKAFVRKERSFEQIKAARKEVEVVKEDHKTLDDRELLTLIGGHADLMESSDKEALEIRDLLAERGLKAKKKLHDRAVAAGKAKPKKEHSFWNTQIAPLWRESYKADSSSDEDEDRIP